MPDEGDKRDKRNSDPSSPSDDDPLLCAIARAPSRPLEPEDEVDPVRVAHFKIAGRLGSGGMGVVYRAQDESLRREVALKLLPPVSAGNPERRQRFLREARVAASLVHPNVAVVHQVGESDGRVYIAMELVDGVTLRQRLEAGPLSIAVVRDLALQIAQGLAAAHAKGIVHRDLKPENVMVTESGGVKLLDFGLAKSGWVSDSDSALGNAETEAQITREGDVLGSSAYMSPEQALGMTVDARSDVFSFGIVLYEMLAGRRPFGGKSLGEIRAAIAREQPVPLGAGADAGLAGIVRKCLEKRAEDRYEDAGVVVLELAAHGTDSERARRDVAAKPRAPAPVPTRLGRWLAAGALAAGVVGLFVLARRNVPAVLDASAAAHAASASRADAASLPYDDGGNPSKSPEAQRLYEQALAAFHGGTGQARTLLKKAIEIDPSFGAAHLRLLITKNLDWPLRYRATVENESTLSARDRTVFATLHEGYSPPDARIQQSKKELDDYLTLHPRDDFALWTRMTFAMNDGDRWCDYWSRAVAGAPSFLTGTAWYARDCLLKARRGRSVEAYELVDKCLGSFSSATDCLGARVDLDQRGDDCTQLEVDARRLVQLRPENADGRDGLANALAAQSAPVNAVREALGTTDDPDQVGWRSMRPVYAPMYEGDFPEVERIANTALKDAIAKKDGDQMLAPGSALIDAYTESSDLNAAARIGEDILPRIRATCDWCISTEATAIAAMVRGGRMPRSTADAQLMDRYRKFARVVDPYQAWLQIYYFGVESTPDAQAALSVFDREVHPSDETSTSLRLANTYARAGRWSEARAIFSKVGGACSLATKTREMMTEHLLRGRVDEDAGDVTSACAHYAAVLSRWGHAKPRSVTADEARARSRALHCPQP